MRLRAPAGHSYVGPVHMLYVAAEIARNRGCPDLRFPAEEQICDVYGVQLGIPAGELAVGPVEIAGIGIYRKAK